VTIGHFPLPSGWRWCVFEDVAAVASDLVDPALTPDAFHIAPNHIESWTGRLLPFGTIRDDGMKSAKHRFRKRQILYSKIRPYLAKATFADFDGLCSADMYPIDTELDPKFLLRWMLTPWFTNEASRSQGRTVLPKINQDTLARLRVPVAPLNEQRRIVAKLDAIFEQTSAVKARLERLPALLEKLKRSILAAAFRGDLTADWRATHPDVEPASALLDRIRTERRRRWESDLRARGKDPAKATYREPRALARTDHLDLPSSWTSALWEHIGDSQNGRAFPSSEYSDKGIRLLRPGNLHASGDVRWSSENTRMMPECWATDFPDFVVGPDELIINLTAQSLKDEFLGRICLTGVQERALLNQRTARLTPILISHCFVLWLFKSPLVRSYIDELNSGSLIQHMFTSQVAKFILPIPPLDEQSILADRLESAMVRIEAMRQAVADLESHLRQLEHTALAKAFRGELVPQNPNDEPAAALLDRIRATRAASAPDISRRDRGPHPADAPTSSGKSNGHNTIASSDDSLDLVVAALQQGEPHLTATAIAEAADLDASAVKQVLKTLVAAGRVRVHGNARGTAYEWIA